MKELVVCNTALDKISKIDLVEYLVEDFPLVLGEKPVGPHGICTYKDNIITANNYNNSISVINLINKKETNNIYIGAYPNDVRVLKDKAYVICGESNSLGIVDLLNNKIIFNLKMGEYPHSLEIFQEKEIAYVGNMEGSSVSIVDCCTNIVINKIKVGEYPTKVLLSKNKKNLFVCESYIGADVPGFISIISTDTQRIINKVKVGRTPIDMCEEEGILYVSNFGEGSISIVDVYKGIEVTKIEAFGMPKGIVKYGDKLYFGEYQYGSIYEINLKDKIIKKIALGMEPNAILLI